MSYDTKKIHGANCEACRGKGWVSVTDSYGEFDKDPCDRCRGTGVCSSDLRRIIEGPRDEDLW